MKKLFAALAVLTFAFTAQATDRTGEFAIGYQTSLGANPAAQTLGQWSVKYGLSSNATIQGIVGFDFTDADDSAAFSFGARFLYDLVENENSDFYTGLGIVYHKGDVASQIPQLDDDGVLTFNVPLGFAFTLANAPAVEFSAEMGLAYNYFLDGTNGLDWTLNSIGGGPGAAFMAGAHYYF